MEKIYLDNAATTKPLDELKDVYRDYADSLWYNPSALYGESAKINALLNEVRETLLRGFGTEHKCLFTGGGTEGANTVILRGAGKRKNMNFVCGGAEHPCVEQSFKQWEAGGCEVRYVKPDKSGHIDPERVASMVDENTVLASVAHVNNETGAKNDIEAIAARVKAKNKRTLFHSDGVQAYLKERVSNTANIDYYTVSAHKLHAHKGTGALFYLPSAPLKPYLLGGGQENGLRSGTQNVLGILSFGWAAEYFMRDIESIRSKYAALRAKLLALAGGMEQTVVVSPMEDEKACSHIVSLSFPGVSGETLLHTLEAEGICVSNGAACSSKKGRTRLAEALSLPDDVAQGMIRVSFSPFNTEQEIEKTMEALARNAALLRKYQRN